MELYNALEVNAKTSMNQVPLVLEKKDVSEKDAKRLKEAVGQLSKLVSNSICADCHQQRSLWASVNFGVFLCSRCAGMHRHLGVHITQVRSINLDTWTPIQLLSVTINGNMWTNSWLLSKKSPDYGRHIMDDPSMSRFIQDKYEHLRYGDNAGILLITKSNFPYITVEKALEVYKLAMTLHRQQVDHCQIRPKLIAAAGFEYPVPTQNPGNRKLLLCLEDSRLGEHSPVTHISDVSEDKNPANHIFGFSEDKNDIVGDLVTEPEKIENIPPDLFSFDYFQLGEQKPLSEQKLLDPTPFLHSTISSSGNGITNQDVDNTKDKDFILSLYRK